MSSDISGKQGTRFLADDEINFLAAKQTHQERSNNKSSGWNAGVSASYGSDGFAFGVTAGGNYGKGYDNGDETTWRTSHIGDKASQTVSLIRDQDNTGQPHTLPCSRCRASAYAA